MRFKKDEWEIQVNNGLFYPIHLDCGKKVGLVNTEGFVSINPDDHDEDSIIICTECGIQSPPLGDFDIIIESVEGV